MIKNTNKGEIKNGLKRIFLIGFRGVGKSHLSVFLAKELGWSVVEMDELIQTRSDKSVLEITKNGTTWEEFRTIETQILLELSTQNNTVVSCGGGVGVNEQEGAEQSQILQNSKNTLVILLNTSVEIIAQRLTQNYQELEANEQLKADHRPSLVGLQNQSVQQKTIKDIEIYQKRLPLYRNLANIEIDTNAEIIDIMGKIVSYI